MRYYHDVVTYRDLKNPGLRVRGCEETRLRVGLGGENMSTADESMWPDTAAKILIIAAKKHKSLLYRFGTAPPGGPIIKLLLQTEGC